MTRGLIIFVKNPALGKVKTRLSAEIGEESALRIYIKLLQHTRDITCNIEADKYVFYSDHIDHNDLWTNAVYQKELQLGNDLGDRMRNAFESLFEKGYKEILIIGSDCFELSGHLILEAFDHLGQTVVVIGPAKDGGYYLLGMNKFIPELFAGKSWSTNNVFHETESQLRSLSYSVSTLPILNDVDIAGDVNFDY